MESSEELILDEMPGAAAAELEFENQIKPMIAAITRADSVTVYEGLPHQSFESELLQAELAKQTSLQLHNYPFYRDTIATSDSTAQQLVEICGSEKSFWKQPAGMMKKCGGFHPDWCLEFKAGDQVYRVLVCFGCSEAMIATMNQNGMVELHTNAKDQLWKILGPLWKNRPQKIKKNE